MKCQKWLKNNNLELNLYLKAVFFFFFLHKLSFFCKTHNMGKKSH